MTMTSLRPALLLSFLIFGLSACEDTGTSATNARVVDGDTLYVDGVKYRLNGIDAPEMNTPYGPSAKAALEQAISGKEVICKPNGDTSYDRLIAICYADGEDVAATVIAAGAALDCARYSNERYRRYETDAARRTLPRATYC